MTSELEGRKRPVGGAKKPYRAANRASADAEFVNYELTEEQVAAYRGWRSDIAGVDTEWQEACENGYKFSTKYDSYSSAFAVFMFPDEGSENYGYILTGRGGTPLRALCECLYKHSRVLRGDWRSVRRSAVSTDDPDW